MSLRRRRSLSEPVAEAARRLKQCEDGIALLDRVRPLNLGAERARLTRECLLGRRPRPRFQYAARAQLGQLRRALADTARSLDASDAEQQALFERSAELSLEASLAEQIGEAGFAALAAERFPVPDGADELGDTAQRWLAAQSPATTPERLHVSDDVADPDSLWSLTSARVSEARLPVRLEVVDGLVALASVADGVVRVRASARLTASVARRIALHEVEGHVRPRVNGQSLGGVFLAGSARASEDEEGRAIWLEARANLLGPERLKELARRYLAAQSLRRGAEFWDTVRLLQETGADVASAVELACRVQRGGGLGRELVYLAGYCRVAAAFAARPELEGVLCAGRVSLSAASSLLEGSVELDDDRNVV